MARWRLAMVLAAVVCVHSQSFDIASIRPHAPVAQGGVPGLDTPAAPGRDHGSIFTAIQDQLGLRLEPQRAPVEVIVIFHFQRPSAN